MTAETKNVLFAEQRQELILRELRASGRVEQAALARMLDVSGESVRKDLAALDKRGLLQRVHGGAIPVASLTLEPAVETRTERRDAKTAIARLALNHLPVTGAILIDAGSTTSMLADLLPADRDITAYTNALVIAASLVDRPNISVRTLGGYLRPQTMAVVGDHAIEMLAGINVDVAFLGTNGISMTRGLTTPDPHEAAVKAAMVHASSRRILLADSSKFGLISQCRHCTLDEVDVLITDSNAPREAVKELARQGVDIEIAQVEPA